jgi:hypothetical protein
MTNQTIEYVTHPCHDHAELEDVAARAAADHAHEGWIIDEVAFHTQDDFVEEKEVEGSKIEMTGRAIIRAHRNGRLP